MADDNGRIKLTWPQITWAIATMALVFGAWFDLRAQVKVVVETMARNEARLVALEARNQITAFTREDAAELKRSLTDEIRRR